MSRPRSDNPAGLPRGRVFLALTVVTTFGVATASAAATTGSSVQFDQYCLACHGGDARGIANLGVDLVDSAFVRSSSRQALVRFLQAGRLPDDPASLTGRPMPGFAWVPESELAAIADFLKSLDAAR